jgi:hypothetical protein
MSDGQDRTRPGLLGGGLSTTGLLIVCVGFLLPQFEGCRGHPVRAAFFNEGKSVDVEYLAGFALPFSLAFVLAILRLLRVIVSRPGARRVLAAVITILCLVALLACPILMNLHMPRSSTDLAGNFTYYPSNYLPRGSQVPWTIAMGAVTTVAVFAWLGLLIIPLRGILAWSLACCGIGALIYGGYWASAIPDKILPGFAVSVFGYAMVTAGALMELHRCLSLRPICQDSETPA